MPNGLHALLVSSLIPLMYGINTLALSQLWHTSHPFSSSQLLTSVDICQHSGHTFFNLPGQIPVCRSVLPCVGASLLCQTLNGDVSYNGVPLLWISDKPHSCGGMLKLLVKDFLCAQVPLFLSYSRTEVPIFSM